ncbi:hypothetical protein TNCV_1269351 [Trichonephila clavipes]|nr:hypothetical protein TNCV_1269351 [Trichonephila clavipes]
MRRNFRTAVETQFLFIWIVVLFHIRHGCSRTLADPEYSEYGVTSQISRFVSHGECLGSPGRSTTFLQLLPRTLSIK